MKSFSIIIETENLGMAGIEDLIKSLESLKSQKYPVGRAKEVLILTGDHVSDSASKILKKDYPWLTIHKEKESLEYTLAKIRGAEVATSDIVIFADSDVYYEKAWLGNILKTFEKYEDADIVAGSTRLENNSAYAMSLNMTWMMQLLKGVERIVPGKYFSLNNFAAKRKKILQVPFPHDLPLYRGKIPFWRNKLLKDGLKIYRAPGAKGYHAPPGNIIDYLYRMLIYGADFVAQADFSIDENGKINQRRNILKRIINLIWLILWKTVRAVLNGLILIKEDPKNLKLLPLATLFCISNMTLFVIGGVIAIVNRDFILKRITARESEHVV